ncbi:unnamed protein product [Choristocarpus tenellus]
MASLALISQQSLPFKGKSPNRHPSLAVDSGNISPFSPHAPSTPGDSSNWTKGWRYSKSDKTRREGRGNVNVTGGGSTPGSIKRHKERTASLIDRFWDLVNSPLLNNFEDTDVEKPFVHSPDDAPGVVGEGKRPFRDASLEATLSLIRSGPDFCSEKRLLVDFVTWVNFWDISDPTPDSGMEDAGTMGLDRARHALLVTDAALYMLEVRMVAPRSAKRRPRAQSGYSEGSNRENGGFLHGTETSELDGGMGTAVEMESGMESDSEAGGQRYKRSTTLESGIDLEAEVEAQRISSIGVISRLEADQVEMMSLPFDTEVLGNGEVMALRSSDIVMHMEGGGYVWLKCRTNQDRGALVETLVRWHQANTMNGSELEINQVLESQLLEDLNPILESGHRIRRSTSCLLS